MLGLPESDPEARVIAAALQEGLREAGWIEGHNIRTDYRWEVNNPDRSRAAVAELLALSPDVILPGTTQMMEAVRQANSSVAAIFVNVSDPVGTGFVASLARPGGNVTGFTNFEYGMGQQWLQVLKEISPGTTRTAVIANPRNPNTALYLHAIAPAAATFALQLAVKPVNDAAEIESAIEAFAREANGSLLVMPDPLTITHRDRIITLAARNRLPAAYPFRLFVTSGGLLSYGVDRVDLYRRAAGYVDRVLKGAKAGELPVQQPTRFELVINLKTATALGLSVPATLLARADEVIE
ncbi:MAG TPA: ABC transporter substrate-binding protein [Microvirga sp.]|nr:ABC transporter substrate-binding protein [Microvirga sp.]